MRINKYLADCGIGSRRKVEEYILNKKVKVNDVIITFFEEKMGKSLEVKKKVVPLHPQSRNKPRIRNAQMAESVDALVSNTSGFTSIPVRPRVWVQDGGHFDECKHD